MRIHRLLAILVLVTGGLVAGCSAGGGAKKSTSAVAPATGADAATGGGAAASAPAPAAAPPGQPADSARRVVLTAELRVRVGDAGAALEQAGAVAAKAGGFVSAQELGRTHRAEAKVTIKAPPAQFAAVQSQLAALGTVLDRSSDASDVTDQVVDIAGRLKTAQASADRLRGIMARSGSAPEIAAVEGELARREADIESLQGRQRVLTDQVDLATVTVTLTEHGQAKASENIPGFASGLRTGWAAFVNTTMTLLTIAGALLPFGVAVGLLYCLVRGVRRLRTRLRARLEARRSRV